jgi:hypothetical protein
MFSRLITETGKIDRPHLAHVEQIYSTEVIDRLILLPSRRCACLAFPGEGSHEVFNGQANYDFRLVEAFADTGFSRIRTARPSGWSISKALVLRTRSLSQRAKQHDNTEAFAGSRPGQ